MTVRSLLNPNVATIDGKADAAEAALLMRREHVGHLVVTEHKDGHTRPIGVITDRDIVVEVVAKRIDPAGISVGDMLRRDLLTVREDNGIEFALRRMRNGGVRRAPVVDGDGRLVGVLSLDDVIEHLATQIGDVAGAIRVQQTVESKQLT